METTTTPARDDEGFVLGSTGIWKYLRDELGLDLTHRQVLWLIEARHIRVGHLGNRLIASRDTLREDVQRAAKGRAA